MIEFDYDKIMQNETVVMCDTEEKANNLLKWADSVGLKWCTNQNYLEYNYWFACREKTCYNLYCGRYYNCYYYKEINYKIYKYEDVIMKKIEDGWYYIKLNQAKEIEKILPPTRCVYVKGNKAMAHSYFYYTSNNMFDVTEDMIKSKAYVIGKEYEFSDNKKDWYRDIYIVYTGYDTYSGYHNQSQKSEWNYVREIQEPEIEINVKINGKNVKLSDISEETLLKIRQNN